MKKLFTCILIILSVLTLANSSFLEPPYADWAHSHVVWYNNTQNQSTIFQMSENYMRNQIPFGGFNIDSGWSTCYNDFIWNKNLFPDPKGLIDYFHSHNVKVMLWATSMVNTNCPNYQEAKDKGYFLNNGKTAKWWHGTGSFVDFFNPEATKWWKSQMDKVLDMGIDAWKCDGTDPITILLRPWPYSQHKKRFIRTHEYSHMYYGTFYNYTKERNPNALIMARPVDSYQEIAYLSYAPKYVMFSGWVGDQNATSGGLGQALSNAMHSAWKGYLNFGFDIGGYRGNRDRVSKNVFLRWAQVGSMVPFMENGGNGLHEPWAFDQQTVDIYRKFVLLHHDLKSFFLTAGTQAYAKKKSVIEPLAKKQGAIAFTLIETFAYKLWQTFVVFPITEDNNIADMKVPQGTWIYYFNHSYILDKRIQAKAFPLDEFPIFVKKGSIYPVQREYLNLEYMSEYRAKNSELNIDEIVLVYLDQGIHNKTFYHRQYTDYFIAELVDSQMKIGVRRFYKNDFINEQLPKVTIRIIGALNSENLKIAESSNLIVENLGENGQNIIMHKFDQKSDQNLVFDIQLNKEYLLSRFMFKKIVISP